MFAVVSPAKKLDFESPMPDLPADSLPRFLDDSDYLIHLLRKKSPVDIAKLMKVSDKIAHLNVERYALWQKDMSDDRAARAAAFAFKGDTYKGLSIDTFDSNGLKEAQSRLRILSGLYGLLRPLDRIRPYRLEMGTRLSNQKGNNLYDFWGDRLIDTLDVDMKVENNNVLVNLASQEYFKVLMGKKAPFRVVSPIFQDEKNGKYKVIGFYAKKARGMMAAWIIKNNPGKPEDLADFDLAGYCYEASASTPDQPVFRRPEVF